MAMEAFSVAGGGGTLDQVPAAEKNLFYPQFFLSELPASTPRTQETVDILAWFSYLYPFCLSHLQGLSPFLLFSSF